MAKKTEAEVLQEMENQAKGEIKNIPEPDLTYVTGSLEEDEQRQEQETKAASRELDEQSSRSEREAYQRLEQGYQELKKDFRELMVMLSKQQGIVAPDSPDFEIPHTAPVEKIPGHALVKILVHASEDPAQNRPVTPALNGRVVVVPRGEIVEVPYWAYAIIRDAVIDTWEYPIENGQYLATKPPDAPPMSTSTPINIKRPRFPVTLISS